MMMPSLNSESNKDDAAAASPFSDRVKDGVNGKISSGVGLLSSALRATRTSIQNRSNRFHPGARKVVGSTSSSMQQQPEQVVVVMKRTRSFFLLLLEQT